MIHKVARVLCLADGAKPAAVEFLGTLVAWLEEQGLEVEARSSVRSIESDPPPAKRLSRCGSR